MDEMVRSCHALAAAMTKSASKQTFYTIRFLADRELANDAYLAYAYFRWADDVIDDNRHKDLALKNDVIDENRHKDLALKEENTQKLAFIQRQRSLLEACYQGVLPLDMCPEECMLAVLIQDDRSKNSGLWSYLRNMMAVMEFDAARRGRVISQAELNEYSRLLATAVTDALYYFIGHYDPIPSEEGRYLSVTAAHITHMLRDTQEDVENLYFNIPGEYLKKEGIEEWETGSRAYHEWVCNRVKLAHYYFDTGKQVLLEEKNLRRRLAGFAYTARFEWLLHAIERDNFCLRSEYPERKGLRASLWMGWTVLSALFSPKGS